MSSSSSDPAGAHLGVTTPDTVPSWQKPPSSCQGEPKHRGGSVSDGREAGTGYTVPCPHSGTGELCWEGSRTFARVRGARHGWSVPAQCHGQQVCSLPLDYQIQPAKVLRTIRYRQAHPRESMATESGTSATSQHQGRIKPLMDSEMQDGPAQSGDIALVHPPAAPSPSALALGHPTFTCSQIPR